MTLDRNDVDVLSADLETRAEQIAEQRRPLAPLGHSAARITGGGNGQQHESQECA